jgi:hypothetical protein
MQPIDAIKQRCFTMALWSEDHADRSMIDIENRLGFENIEILENDFL